MIINSENLFLIILAFIWVIGAMIQDLRRREVDNIWNFSLVAFALAYRAFASVHMGNHWFFINGVLGFLIFLFFGNLFYYSRLFAGGDAKLLMALGSVLPLSYDWYINFKIFGIFILLFFITGSIYVLIWSFFLVLRSHEKFLKEFRKQSKKYRIFFIISFFFVLASILFALFLREIIFYYTGFIIFLFPVLYIFAKTIEESFMVKALYPEQITVGDWLYKDINIGGKIIKARWDGISKRELNFIRKEYRRKILIKQGIPFTPSFLFGLIALLIVSKLGWF